MSSSCINEHDPVSLSEEAPTSFSTPEATVNQNATNVIPSTNPELTSSQTPQPILDPDGPWLVFASDDYRPHVALISGLVNEAQQNVDLMPPSGQEEYLVVPRMLPHAWSGQGNLTALLWRSPSFRDVQIALYQLPDDSPQLRIPLTSEATFATEDENCTTNDCSILSVLAPVFSRGRVFRWSPDGQYLAYTSAVAGPHSDLYLLNALDGHSQQLTHNEAEVQVIGWSPSGETLLYEESSSVEEAGFKPSRLIAYDISSGETSIIETYPEEWTWPYDVSLIGWTEDGNTVLTTRVFELGETALRLMYIDLPGSSLLYDGFVTDPVVDPSLSQVYYSIFPSDYQDFFPNEPAGLYSSNLNTGQLTLLTLSREARAVRLVDLQATAMTNDQGTWLQFDDGRRVQLLPSDDELCDLCRAFPWSVSPDGTKLMSDIVEPETEAEYTGLVSLMDDEASWLARFDFRIRSIEWLPDSSGLILLSDGQIYLSTDALGWDPIMIFSSVYYSYNAMTIVSP